MTTPQNTFARVALLFTGRAPEHQGAPGLPVLQDAVFLGAPLVRVTKREGVVPLDCCHHHFMNTLPGDGQVPVLAWELQVSGALSRWFCSTITALGICNFVGMSLIVRSPAHRAPPAVIIPRTAAGSAATSRRVGGCLGLPDILCYAQLLLGHSFTAPHAHCSQQAKTRLGLGLKFSRLFAVCLKNRMSNLGQALSTSVVCKICCFFQVSRAHRVTLPPPNSASTSWAVGVLPGSCLTTSSVGDVCDLLNPKEALPVASRAWESVPPEVEDSPSPGFRPHLAIPNASTDIPILQHPHSHIPLPQLLHPLTLFGTLHHLGALPPAELVPGPMGRGHLAENLP